MENFQFGSRTYIMGILNLTPDSFSGDGIYKDVDRALEKAQKFIGDGADIIDVGGESTRPGAQSLTVEEELERVVPVVKRLAQKVNVPISIDTTKSEVARQALENGASIINDISGLDADQKMRSVAAKCKAYVIIMHMKGTPQTMQINPTYENLIKEIIERLKILIEKAERSGIKKEHIIVDPGIGFGKTVEHNLEILAKLSRFKELGRPILIGPSRKSFIGKLLGAEPQDRIFGTASAVAIAIRNGADIIRVHDIKEMKDVATIVDAIVRNGTYHD